MLVQDARFFDESFSGGRLMHQRLVFALKRWWVHRSIRRADQVCVQSQTLADTISTALPETRNRTAVIRHGPGCIGDRSGELRQAGSGETLEIVYVAYYYPHKNFRVLLDALRILADRQVQVHLHLTLDHKSAAVRELLSYARSLGVDDAVVNHGELESTAIATLYRDVHLSVFPSTCESFGFPQVEAMAFGLPIIAADTRVNREVCADAALYFPPHDPGRLAELIANFYLHPADLLDAAMVSRTRAEAFDWKQAAGETLEWLTSHGIVNRASNVGSIAVEWP
jgi:glycosyltransferase involved in cell wall biosynthesis